MCNFGAGVIMVSVVVLVVVLVVLRDGVVYEL